MRNFLFTIFSVALATIFTACSSSTAEDIISQEEGKGTISASLRNYEVDDTRTTHIFSASGMKFSWENGDQLGCFPTSMDPAHATTQVLTPQNINGANADFGQAKDVGIRSNTEYTAYFKYDSKNEGIPYTAIPVSYSGQVQKANAKASLSSNLSNDTYMQSEAAASAHLGDFNYMTSATVKSAEVSGALHFKMEQIQSILRFYIKVPQKLLFSRIDVVNNDTEFTIAGTVNITDDERTINTAGSSDNKSHCISLGLSGEGFDFREGNSDYYIGKDGYIIAYMMVAPVVLTTPSSFYLVGTNSEGATKCFKADLKKRTFTRGKAYVWTINDSVEDPIILDEVTVEEWQKATGYENENGKGTETW